MDESSTRPRSRVRWVIVGAIGVIAAGVITWGIISNIPTHSEVGSAPTSSGQVEDLPEPEPGKTTPIEKSKPPLTVKIGERAEPITKTFVEVVSVESVTAGRAIPGEPTGPAVKVEVRLVNDSQQAVSTAGASVNLTYGEDDLTPAVSLTDAATQEWPTEVPAGQSANSTFLFALPDGAKGNIRVIVDLLATGPDVVFEGPRP